MTDKKKPSKTPPLSFVEYTRIHNVVQSLAEHFVKDVGRSCVFFSVIGAVIMHKHYNKNAKVICGGGAVVVAMTPEGPQALSWLTETSDGRLEPTAEGFHAWVEIEDWMIDFMAPNYREAMVGSKLSTPIAVMPVIPRKMFQKPISQVDGGLDKLTRLGRAAFHANQSITMEMLDKAFERPAMEDIINIATTWHKSASMRMEPSITITNDLGKLTTIELIKRELVGAW